MLKCVAAGLHKLKRKIAVAVKDRTDCDRGKKRRKYKDKYLSLILTLAGNAGCI